MLDNMIDLWAKKSLDEKVYNYCQVNKNHILSIDFEDDIQINLINGVTYFAFYDVFHAGWGFNGGAGGKP